jgi:hypothetical protein
MLKEAEDHVGEPQPFLEPLLAVWRQWPDEL